jgi:hypothetical protein
MLALLAAGCGERPEIWDQPLKVMGPYEAADRVLWVDATRGLVLALQPRGDSPSVQATAIRRNANFVVLAPDRKSLMVLTAGKEARLKDQQPEKPGLTLVSVDKEGRPVVTAFYPLSSAFSRLAVSADGKRAVAFHGQGQSSGVFVNPLEVALLDLTRPAGSDNPTLRTLRSFGAAPLGVSFSPPMTLSATSRTLAVVLSDNQLTLLDADNPNRAEITVPLKQLGSSASVSPQELQFSAANATIFVRASGSADVYALKLASKEPSGPTGNDFSVVVNQPSSGKTVLDMALFSDGGKDMLLTANATQDVSLIEADTSRHSLISIGEPVDTLLLVPATKPTLALIYGRLQRRARVHVLKLEGLATALEQNLVSRDLAYPVHQLVATPDGQRALVIHNASRTVVSLLDLAGKHFTVSPIQGQLALESYDFTNSPYLAGVSRGIKSLGLLDLANLHPRNLRLDHSPSRVLALGDLLVVDHGVSQGQVTIVPSPKAERADCRVLWGVFLEGLLDRELVD